MSDSTGQLLTKAQAGDQEAVNQLLARHRDRLRRMLRVRMEPALSTRLDESDVLQESLAEAARKLPEYFRRRPVPFYPWLRSIAWEKFVDLRRSHLAQKRSVTREVAKVTDLPDHSAVELASCLIASGTSPSLRIMKQEMQQRVRASLDSLPADDRELLTLKYLERLPTREIAAVIGASEKAVRARHRRALQQLRLLLDDLGDSNQ